MAVSVLIPTFERPEALVMTLSGVAARTPAGLRVVVSSRGRVKAEESPTARSLGSAPWARDRG